MLLQVIQNDNIDHNPQLDEIIFFFQLSLLLSPPLTSLNIQHRICHIVHNIALNL